MSKLLKKIQRKKRHQLQSRDTEYYLLRIPILGYILRKIQANRESIETTLRTGKETEGETRERRLFGIFHIVSSKTFTVLKLKGKKRKNGQRTKKRR